MYQKANESFSIASSSCAQQDSSVKLWEHNWYRCSSFVENYPRHHSCWFLWRRRELISEAIFYLVSSGNIWLSLPKEWNKNVTHPNFRKMCIPHYLLSHCRYLSCPVDRDLCVCFISHEMRETHPILPQPASKRGWVSEREREKRKDRERERENE